MGHVLLLVLSADNDKTTLAHISRLIPPNLRI